MKIQQWNIKGEDVLMFILRKVVGDTVFENAFIYREWR
jgi:hypothetical protein